MRQHWTDLAAIEAEIARIRLQSYQTPCVQGHACECVWYTTVHRTWVDCRSYGKVKPTAWSR